jgi:alpha-glucosidase (family GH31 glycosyl hydrolase)
MLGPSLLVSPIYDEGEWRSVYLPEGRWIDYWTQEIHEGPTNIRVHAPLDTLPLFVCAGAVLPMMPPVQRIPDSWIDPLILEVYPHAPIAYRLNEDEGIVDFTGEAQEDGITLAWNGARERQWIIRFKGVHQPKRVELATNDQPATPVDEWRALQDATLEINVPAVSSARLWIGYV